MFLFAAFWFSLHYVYMYLLYEYMFYSWFDKSIYIHLFYVPHISNAHKHSLFVEVSYLLGVSIQYWFKYAFAANIYMSDTSMSHNKEDLLLLLLLETLIKGLITYGLFSSHSNAFVITVLKSSVLSGFCNLKGGNLSSPNVSKLVSWKQSGTFAGLLFISNKDILSFTCEMYLNKFPGKTTWKYHFAFFFFRGGGG